MSVDNTDAAPEVRNGSYYRSLIDSVETEPESDDVSTDDSDEQSADVADETESDSDESSDDDGDDSDDGDDESATDDIDEGDSDDDETDEISFEQIADVSDYIANDKAKAAFIKLVDERYKPLESVARNFANPESAKRELESLNDYYKQEFNVTLLELLGAKSDDQQGSEEVDDLADVDEYDRKLVDKAVQIVERKFGDKLKKIEELESETKRVKELSAKEQRLKEEFKQAKSKFASLEGGYNITEEQFRSAMNNYPNLEPVKALRLELYEELKKRSNRQIAKRNVSKKRVSPPVESTASPKPTVIKNPGKLTGADYRKLLDESE